ncbi:MAG TPA: substrate-binding domain-containing protein [Gammaproteobacteria bacterium]|nr:substrate-binding domain-containing protein [Gammaproteobacteria bacterium]
MSARSLRAAAALLVALASIGLGSAQPSGQSAPVRALSSNGVRAALEQVVPQCERTVGRKLDVQFGTSASIKQRIEGGEAIDVAFITSEVVAELAKGGHLAASSITPLGRAGIGVGIRIGARTYDIGTADAIKQALLTASSVTYAQDGASRVHIESMFEKLGIAQQMKAKTMLEQGSTRAAAKVVDGEAELLLTLVSEILPVADMDLLGPLPKEFQSYISFDAAVGAHPADLAAARAFVACVASPQGASVFAEKGIER